MAIRPSAMPLFALTGIRKSYGAVDALKGVDLEVWPGEVLAICGDNGAGKSTLIKIMSGAEVPDSGEIRLSGKPVSFGSPQDALEQGVATIYQDLALAPRLSIRANVFMGAELTRPLLLPFLRILDKKRMASEARAYLHRLSINLPDVERPVADLSGGQRQAVAIARALHWNAAVIIMDEPTAALGVKETGQVLALIARLHAAGQTVILISHNMRDVCQVATRVAILKNGRKVEDRPVSGLTPESLGGLIMNAA